MAQATEAQAEAAILILKRAIEAAENSNQAGENAVVKFAAAPDLYEALESAIPEIEDEVRSLIECHSVWGDDGKPDRSTIDPEVGEHVAKLEAIIAAGRSSLAKARGEA